MNMREQARVDVNAATASDVDGQIKNLPLLYLYAVEQRERVHYLRAALARSLDGVDERKVSCGEWAERLRKIARVALEATN